MHLLSCFALIFLTLFGYSAGAVLGRKTRLSERRDVVQPTLIDTALVIVIWCAAFACRLTGQMSPWRAVACWFTIALTVAFAVNCIQKSSDREITILQ
jgi:hypothetical protein